MVTLQSIFEKQKDLTTFEKLLKAFADYSDAFPATGVDNIVSFLLKEKTKVMPKDKLALEVLEYAATSKDNPSGIVQQVLNLRFSDLPVECRPMYEYESGEKKVACWKVGDKVSDRVVSLLNIGQEGSVVGWVCCCTGEKVKPLTTPKEM